MMCTCGHHEDDHILNDSEFSRPCDVKGCVCQDFTSSEYAEDPDADDDYIDDEEED